MKPSPRYNIIRESPTEVLIMDIGPWTQFPTVTNRAEQVVEELFPRLRGRRLYYVDSEGIVGELLIKDGKFAGFAG